MFRTILTYTGWSLLAAMLGAYFFFAARLSNAGKENEVCSNISVTLLDSVRNKFVTKSEVVNIIEDFTGSTIGKRVNDINLANIELLLDKRSAIKKSQVSISRNGKMSINITQRKPLLRIQTENGGFYIDRSEFIFPLVSSFTSYVPIVSGNIPLVINAEHKGKAIDEGSEWIGKITEFGIYLEDNPFWNAMIEQIYVEKNGDIILSPKVGNFKIVFGDLNNIESKFNRLLAFYKNIAPNEGWNKYSVINLKYKGQIVCKIDKRYKAKQNNNKANNTL